MDFILWSLNDGLNISIILWVYTQFDNQLLVIFIQKIKGSRVGLFFIYLMETFSNIFLALLIVKALFLSSLYNISPTCICQILLSSKGIPSMFKERSTVLNWDPDGRDCDVGRCKECFILFLSKPMEARNVVWLGIECDANNCNMSYLNFLFLSSITCPSSLLGLAADELPKVPNISTFVEVEIVFF